MDLKGKNFVEWVYDTSLTSAAVVPVPIGFSLSGQTLLATQSLYFLTWGLISSHNCRLDVLGYLHVAGAPAVDVIYTQLAVGGVYTTPYLLGGNQGLTGHVVFTRPFVVLRLTETATVDHTYTRFYAKAWG